VFEGSIAELEMGMLKPFEVPNVDPDLARVRLSSRIWARLVRWMAL